jgi:hypothetical protein
LVSLLVASGHPTDQDVVTAVTGASAALVGFLLVFLGALVARGDQQSPSSLRKASTSSLTSAAVLDRGWQKVGWESGRKRGDDEGEEAEDAETAQRSCGVRGRSAESVDGSEFSLR